MFASSWASEAKRFFLKSDGLKVSDIAVLVSEEFSVSILPHPSIAAEEITATIAFDTVEEGLQVLEFLTGKSVRNSNDIYYLGGEGEESFTVVDAPVAIGSQANNLAGMNTTIVGRSMIVNGDQGTIADAATLSQEITQKADEVSVGTFRICVIDIAERDSEPFGEWLRRFEIGAVVDTRATTDKFAQPNFGELRLSIVALIQFVEGLRSSNVATDTIVTFVDGQSLTISAGQVLEREIQESVPTDGGGASFLTGFDRLNIGFDLTLEPLRLLTGWQLAVGVSDSSLINDQENRTEYQGATVIRDARRGAVLLADLTRKGQTRDEDRLNFGLLKRVKRYTIGNESRRLVLFIEPVLPLDLVEPVRLRAVPVLQK